MTPDYNKTVKACYLAFITQAILANFPPLLFLTLRESYALSLGQIAAIPAVYFMTQLIVDLICASFADRAGYRAFLTAGCVLCIAGLWGIAFLPEFTPSPFAGILLSVIAYGSGAGIIDVLCSPLVEACPCSSRETALAMLHSFYCWGAAGAILLSALFFIFIGIEYWRWLAILWSLLPLLTLLRFLRCPFPEMVKSGGSLGFAELFRQNAFWIATVVIFCAGASEMCMAQWASAYAESALGLSKTLGDIAGPFMFSVTMGIVRLLFGKFGEKADMVKSLIISGAVCLACYLLAAFAASPVLGLAGCILCGASVAIMWPGTLSVSSGKIPRGGTSLFAMLGALGDIGCSAGPGILGLVTQNAGNNFKAGMLFACAFPLILIVSVLLLKNAGVAADSLSDGG